MAPAVKARKSGKKSFFLDWLPYLVIFILALLVYKQTLQFHLIEFDDKSLIIDNYRFIKNPGNVLDAFRHGVFYINGHSPNADDYYRPMLTISFMLDAQMGGLGLAVYYRTNLILHIIASCLVFYFFTRLSYSRQTSFLFASLFTVHPLLSQAIAWIPGRNDILLALFGIPAFLSYVKYSLAPRYKFLLLHLLFFMLALFSKESAVVILPLCLSYSVLILGDGVTGVFSKESVIRFLRKNLLFFTGWLALLGLWWWMRHQALSSNTYKPSWTQELHNLITNLPVLLQYIGKFFIPWPLSAWPTAGSVPSVQSVASITGMCMVVLLSVGLVFSKLKNNNRIIWGLGWFILLVLPTLIIPFFVGLEQRVYLPVLGVFVIIAEIDFVKFFDYSKKSAIGLSIAMTLFLSLIAYRHAQCFQDRSSFLRNVISTNPTYIPARLSLAELYDHNGIYDLAEEGYKQVLEISPKEKVINNNLGVLYSKQKRMPEAEKCFLREMENNPDYADSYFNLGILYFQQYKDSLKMEFYLKKAIEKNSDHVNAMKFLAALYYEKNNTISYLLYVEELQKRGFPPPPPHLLKVLNP